MNAIQENNTAKGTAGKNNNRSLTRRVADKFMTGAGIFTFLRSSVASQIASWIDMGVCFIFYAWVFMPLGKDPLRSFLATAIGLVVGGVVKYFLIWGGSFLLNLVGTTALDHLLQHAGWLEHIGFKADGIFVFARLAVSLIVSLAWNFLLQKNFVYVYTRFDPFAIKFIDFITPHRKKLKKSNTRQSKADKTH